MYDLRELLVGSFLSGISPLFSHRNDRSTESTTDPFPVTSSFSRRRVTIILRVFVRRFSNEEGREKREKMFRNVAKFKIRTRGEN